jgi:LPS sulfotransferase NodH
MCPSTATCRCRPAAGRLPGPTFVRVVRNKIRQAVSLWKAVQSATWRQEEPNGSVPEDTDTPSYQGFVNDLKPQMRFHYGAIRHLLNQLIQQEAARDAFFEHTRIKPTLVLYETTPIEPSTRSLLVKLDIDPPDDLKIKTRMKSQSDGINDDWARRYSEIRLGTEFDLVPAVPSLS